MYIPCFVIYYMSGLFEGLAVGAFDGVGVLLVGQENFAPVSKLPTLVPFGLTICIHHL